MPGLSAPSAKIFTFKFSNGFCIYSPRKFNINRKHIQAVFCSLVHLCSSIFRLHLKNNIGGFAQALNAVMGRLPQRLGIAMVDENRGATRCMPAVDVPPAV